MCLCACVSALLKRGGNGNLLAASAGASAATGIRLLDKMQVHLVEITMLLFAESG